MVAVPFADIVLNVKKTVIIEIADVIIAPNRRATANSNSAMSEVDELTLMAAIIYCEAGAEPYETQLAVGAVIMNRIRSSRFPNNLYDVLSQPGQFTPYRTGKLAAALANAKATPSCYDAARAALAGEDNTSNCLFFNDYNGTREGLRYGGMVFWW